MGELHLDKAVNKSAATPCPAPEPARLAGSSHFPYYMFLNNILMLLFLTDFQLTSKNGTKEQDAVLNWQLSVDLVEKVHRSYLGEECSREREEPVRNPKAGARLVYSETSTGVGVVRMELVRRGRVGDKVRKGEGPYCVRLQVRCRGFGFYPEQHKWTYILKESLWLLG